MCWVTWQAPAHRVLGDVASTGRRWYSAAPYLAAQVAEQDVEAAGPQVGHAAAHAPVCVQGGSVRARDRQRVTVYRVRASERVR